MGRLRRDSVGRCGFGRRTDIIRYHRGRAMADILIRDVPEDVVAAIDARAQREGLSRTEYLRRALARERASESREVTVEDLAGFGELFADLDDPEMMGRAWS